MSGEGIRRSIWIFLLPLFFMFGLLVIIIVSQVDLSGLGVPADFTGGLLSGISQILPELGIGLGIALLFLVFCVIKRRSQ